MGCSVLLWVLGLIRFVSNGSTRLLNSVKLSYRFHLDLCCVKKGAFRTSWGQALRGQRFGGSGFVSIWCFGVWGSGKRDKDWDSFVVTLALCVGSWLATATHRTCQQPYLYGW